MYVINITKIPDECDITNEKFKIKIDGDNVTFSNPIPNNSSWQTSSRVNVGITLTDTGGGYVNGTNIMQSYSTDNGITWSSWKKIQSIESALNICPQDSIVFENGIENFIKWRASDTFGNGPTESDKYRVLVDTQNVTFSNFSPLSTEISSTEIVDVSITISDLLSSVNTSTIEYTISTA